MAKYRMYKNGIYGHRYKGYFIIREIDEKNGKKTFSVVDEKSNVIRNNLKDFWDSEWEIDKLTASDAQRKAIRALYSENVSVLSRFFLDLMDKENSTGLSVEEQEFYTWVQKVRRRKAEDRAY